MTYQTSYKKVLVLKMVMPDGRDMRLMDVFPITNNKLHPDLEKQITSKINDILSI